jgi:predicted RNase H-like HicB family nuclease
LRRGLYELVPQYRKESKQQAKAIERVGETGAVSETSENFELKDSVHVAIAREKRAYVAECLEIAVVAQGATLDEMVDNLREAVALHLEGEDRGVLGLSTKLRLVFTWELPLENVTET